MTGQRRSNDELKILVDGFFERFGGVTERYFVEAFNQCLDQSDFFPTIRRVVENYDAIVKTIPAVVNDVPRIEDQPASREYVRQLLEKTNMRLGRVDDDRALSDTAIEARRKKLKAQARQILADESSDSNVELKSNFMKRVAKGG